MNREIRRIERDGGVQRTIYDRNGQVVRLIRPVEGEREFMGTLSAYDEDGTVTLLDGDEGDEEQLEMVFSPQEIAYVRVYEEF